ncbi:MAG: hypothetical protein ACLSHG_08955 [Oscillospiraceae bacterium]
MNAVVAVAANGQERRHRSGPAELQKLADYWADVRLRYEQLSRHGHQRALSPISTATRSPAASTPTCKPQVESPGPRPPASRRSRRCTHQVNHHAGRHRQGHALLQNGGRSGHLHGAE